MGGPRLAQTQTFERLLGKVLKVPPTGRVEESGAQRRRRWDRFGFELLRPSVVKLETDITVGDGFHVVPSHFFYKRTSPIKKFWLTEPITHHQVQR